MASGETIPNLFPAAPLRVEPAFGRADRQYSPADRQFPNASPAEASPATAAPATAVPATASPAPASPSALSPSDAALGNGVPASAITPLVYDGITMPTNVKILAPEKLATQLADLRAAGRRVVLCHGVFDLVHPGHIRHLAAAKRHGDLLVVGIAADHIVNKGPGRPVFPAQLRAENVAALQDVDYVAIDGSANLPALIRLLKPDVYVIGRNGTLGEHHTAEEAAVREAGGRLEFTNEATFSSSKLLNDILPVYPPEVHAYLADFRSRHQASRIVEMIESLKDLRVLVVGEAIMDEYVYGHVIGKSAKEPILAMRYASREIHAGGSVAIANHLAEFCRGVELVAYLGENDTHEEAIRRALRENVTPHFIAKPNSPTIVKRRFVESYSVTKLLEVYEMNDEPLAGDAEERLCGALESRLSDCDVVIAADYGHGLITNSAVKLLSRRAKFLAVNTQINAANTGFHALSKYPRAHFVCVHEGEIRLDCRDRTSDIRQLMANIVDRMTGRAVMVTQGKFGTLLYRPEDGFAHCPALSVKVVDRVGAGDSLLAISSLCMARDWPLDVAGFVANMVGAQAVRIVGNRSAVRRDLLIQGIESILK